MRADGIPPTAGPELDVGDRGDRGQGLAAKAERGDTRQILRIADLARRVRLEGDRRVLPRHALSIVRHRDARAPPLVDLDDDAPRTGIE